MVSWVLVPVALLFGVIVGITLIALVSANQDDDRPRWGR